MTPQTQEKDRARKAGWAIKNADRLKVKNAAYYQANRKKLLARSLEWADKNKDRVDANQAVYRKENAERRRENTRRWASENPTKKKQMDAAYRQANPEAAKARHQAWCAANPGAKGAIEARRRAAKLKATPVWADKSAIKKLYAEAKARTKESGFQWHVDHIVPLKSKIVCGLHVESNLAVITGAENVRKYNRHWPDMP